MVEDAYKEWLENFEEGKFTYYCQICEIFHQGTVGVCPTCNAMSSGGAMFFSKSKVDMILEKHHTEDDFIEGWHLRGAGWFNKEWDNTEQLRLFYKCCLKYKNK